MTWMGMNKFLHGTQKSSLGFGSDLKIVCLNNVRKVGFDEIIIISSVTSWWGHSNLTSVTHTEGFTHRFLTLLPFCFGRRFTSTSMAASLWSWATLAWRRWSTVRSSLCAARPLTWHRRSSPRWGESAGTPRTGRVVKDGGDNKTVISPRTTCSSEDNELLFLFRHWQLWAEGRRLGSWCHHLHPAVWLSSVSQVCAVLFFRFSILNPMPQVDMLDLPEAPTWFSKGGTDH